MPRDQIERKNILKILDSMSQLPRLGDQDHWLATQEQTVKVRVGEIDQTAHSTNISSWDKTKSSRPFIRGVHFTEDELGNVYIRHPAFRKDIPSRANERQLAMWSGEKRCPIVWSPASPARRLLTHTKNVVFDGLLSRKDASLATA